MRNSAAAAAKDSKPMRSGTMYLTESLIKQLTKEDDIKTITHLDIESTRGDRKLATIEHLHSLHNLTHLNLRGNNIVRMEGLASLLQLLHLNLADNHIQKIEGFDSLSKLSLLDVSGNRIERVPPLKRLGALRIFRISFNLLFRLDDITNLKYLLSLHHLSVKSNPCCDSADPSGVIVFHLPSLLTLDGQDVTPELRAACQKRFGLFEIERIEQVVRSQEARLAEVESLNAALREQMKGSVASTSKLRDSSDRSRKGNEALQDELSTVRELLEKKTSELSKKELMVSELKHKLASYLQDNGAVAFDATALHAQERLTFKRRMLNDLNQLVDTLTCQCSQLALSAESLRSHSASAPNSPASTPKRKPTSDAERRVFKNVERLERFEKNYCERIQQVADVIASLPRSDDDASGDAAELRRQNRQLHVLTKDREANLKQLLLAQEELHSLQSTAAPVPASPAHAAVHNSEQQQVFDTRGDELLGQLGKVQLQLSEAVAQRQILEEEIRGMQASAIDQSGVSDLVLNASLADMPPAESLPLISGNLTAVPTVCESCQTDSSDDSQSNNVRRLVGALLQICEVAHVEGNIGMAPDSLAADLCSRFSVLQASNDELLQNNLSLKASNDELLQNNLSLKASNDELLQNNLSLKASNDELLQNNLSHKASNDELVQSNLSMKASNDELLQNHLSLKDALRRMSDVQAGHEADVSRLKQELDSACYELAQKIAHTTNMESKHRECVVALEVALSNAQAEIHSSKANAPQPVVSAVRGQSMAANESAFDALKRVADALAVVYSVKDTPEHVGNLVFAHFSTMQDSIARLREMHRIVVESEAAQKLEVSRLEADLETAFQQVSALVTSSGAAAKSPARLSNAKFAAMQAAFERIAKELTVPFTSFDSPDMFAETICSQFAAMKAANERIRDSVSESGRLQAHQSALASAAQSDMRKYLATVSALQEELQQARQQLQVQASIAEIPKADAAVQIVGSDLREALDKIARELFIVNGSEDSAHDVADAVCSQIRDLSEGSERLRSLLREFADADAVQKDAILELEHELQMARDDVDSFRSQSAARSLSPELRKSARDVRDVNALQRIAQALSFEFSEEADVECVSETVCLEINGLQESNRRLRELQSSTSDELAVQKEVVLRLEAELRESSAEMSQSASNGGRQSPTASSRDGVFAHLERIARELSVYRSESDSADAFTSLLCCQVSTLQQRLLDVRNSHSELERSFRDTCEQHTSAVSSLLQAEARILELELRSHISQEADSDAELQIMLNPSGDQSYPQSSQLETGIQFDGTSESHETLIRLLESLNAAELHRAQAEDAAAQAVAEKESAVRSAEQAVQQSEKQRVLLASLQQEVFDMQKALELSQSQSSKVVVKQFASATAMAQSLQDKEDKLRLVNSELETIEKRILNRKGELDGVLKELQQADSRRSDVDRAILAGTNQLLELESQLLVSGDALEEEKLKMQSIVQSHESTIASLSDRIQAQTQTMQLTEARLVQKCDEVARLESITACIPKSQATLQKLVEECDSARNLLQHLEQKRVEVASEIQLLGEERATTSAQRDLLNQQLESLSAELSDVKRRVSLEHERARSELQSRQVHASAQTVENRCQMSNCEIQTEETCVSLDDGTLQMRSLYSAERASTSKLVLSISALLSVFSTFCSFSSDESSSSYDLFSKVEQSAANFRGVIDSIVALESEAVSAGVHLPRIESDCLSLLESCQLFLDNVHASSESLSRHVASVRDVEQQFLRQQRILEECLSVYDTFREKIVDAERKQTMLEEQNCICEAELEGTQLRLHQCFQEEHSAKIRLQEKLSEVSSIQDQIKTKMGLMESLESDAQSKRDELISVQLEIDDVSCARDEVLRVTSTCEMRLRSLEKQQSDLLCELSELGTRVLRLNSEVLGLEEAKRDAAGQCSALEQRRLELTDSMPALEQQHAEFMCKLSELGAAASNLNSEVARLEEIKREGEGSCSLLAAKHEELSQTLQLLDVNASTRLASLNEEERRCSLAISKLKAEIASQSASLHEISQNKQTLVSQTEAVQSKLIELHSELADCTVSLQLTKEQHQSEIGKWQRIQVEVANEQRVVAEAKEELYGAVVASESLNSQLEALISQIDQKQQEMELLRHQMAEQMEQLSQQQLLVSQAVQNKDKLLAEVEVMESRRSSLVADIQNKGHQISSYDEQIAICSSKDSLLRSSLDLQSASLEKAVAELASVKRAHQEFELNCDMLRRQEIELSARLPAIRIELEEGEHELGAVETALSRMRQEFIEKDSEVSIRRNQLESMHKEISSLSSQLEGLHSAISDERTALSAVQAQVQDHRQQVSELKSVIREKSRESDALSSSLAQLQAACVREKETAHAVSVETGSLASTKDELRRSLDQLDRKHLQSQIDAQQHQAAVASLARAKDKAEEMLKRTKDEHDAAILRLDKAASALKEKELCVEAQSNRLESLRAEANECRQSVDALRLEKQRIESSCTQVRHEFKLCERELLEAKDDLRRVRREADGFKEQMAQERTRLDAAAKDVKEREAQLSQAQATFSIDSAALAAAEESISQIQSLADNFGADLRHEDDVRTSASSLPNMSMFSESWESFSQHGSPSKLIRSSTTLSAKLMRLVRVADLYKNSVASSKAQLGDLQSRLTEHQLQLSQVQAEESRCTQSIVALKDERASLLSSSSGQLQSSEAQLKEVRDRIQQMRSEEQVLLATLKTLQQQCVDSREQADRLVATMEQHGVAERQANAACEIAVQKRRDLEEQSRLAAAASISILAEKEALEQRLADMKTEHSSLADEMSTIAEMKSALEVSLLQMSQFVSEAEQKASAATSLHSAAARSMSALQQECEDLKQDVASLRRLKAQVVDCSKQCVSHVEDTLSSILHTLQSSLSADAVDNIMPKFESLVSAVLADLESIAAAVAVVENSDSLGVQQSASEAALLAKLEHYKKQIRDAEQRLADVDLRRQDILAQLEEKVNQSGRVVSSNRAESNLLQEKVQSLQLQVQQMNEKLALLNSQVASENEALSRQEQLRADVQMECEESFSKLQAERRLCLQLEGTAADLRSQNTSVEREIAVAREQLQQQQLLRGSVLEHLQIEQQQVLSARQEHESLRHDVLALTLGVQDFVSRLMDCNFSSGEMSASAELPSSAPPLLQPLLDQLQRMCASFVLATSRQQLESEQPLASTSDMLLINSEMADLRVRLSALQAQALEAEQRWQRAESAAAAAESRLSESSHLQDSAYQSALGQIRDARDALASKLDEQQQRIRSMCSRLRSSLSSLPVQSSEGPSPSNDSLEQLELLLGKVESVVLRVSVGDAATPLPMRPQATPLMGGVGASTIASAASTAARFSSPMPLKTNQYPQSSHGHRLAAHGVAGDAADEATHWLELQLAMCRQEFTVMENRYQHAMESSASWRSEREELLRCIASLNARLAIAEEGGAVRVAAARDEELKQALKAMERRLEMRQNLGSLASRVKNECISDLRQKLGMAEH